MNSAEFKTLREAVGLSVSQAAELFRVDTRTVRYWESGRNKPPAGASQQLTDIDAMIERSLQEAIRLYEEKKPDEILLYRYADAEELHKAHPGFKPLPVTVHAALLYRAKKYFESQSIPVQIEYKH